MSLTSLLISTAEVKQLSTGQNAMGGVTKSYTTRIATLRCRIWPKTLTETDSYGKKTMIEVWKLACEATATNLAIIESDQIVFGGSTYEITGIGNPSSMNHHLELDLREVD